MSPSRIAGVRILLFAGIILLGCPITAIARQHAGGGKGHTVTKVVVIGKPSTYTGPCPAEIQFVGTIFVSEPPVTVEYEWERSDGARGERHRLEIRSAGQGVYETWKLGEPTKHMRVWERLHILSPRNMTSPHAVVTINCAGESPRKAVQRPVQPSKKK